MKTKTKKSASKRVKLTRGGKVMRRATSLGHSRANKSGIQLGRKKRSRGMMLSKQTIKKFTS